MGTVTKSGAKKGSAKPRPTSAPECSTVRWELGESFFGGPYIRLMLRVMSHSRTQDCELRHRLLVRQASLAKLTAFRIDRTERLEATNRTEPRGASILP